MQQVVLTDHESREPVFIDIENSLQFSVGSMSGGPTRLIVTRFKPDGSFTNEEYKVRESEPEVKRSMIAAGARDEL